MKFQEVQKKVACVRIRIFLLSYLPYHFGLSFFGLSKRKNIYYLVGYEGVREFSRDIAWALTDALIMHEDGKI